MNSQRSLRIPEIRRELWEFTVNSGKTGENRGRKTADSHLFIEQTVFEGSGVGGLCWDRHDVEEIAVTPSGLPRSRPTNIASLGPVFDPLFPLG